MRGGRGGDGEEVLRELVKGVIKELHAIVVDRAGVGGHDDGGHGGGVIQGAVNMLQDHVEGDVDEIALMGVESAGEVNEGVNAEGGEAGPVTSPGDGPGGGSDQWQLG